MSAIRILSTKKLLPSQKQFLLNAGFSVIEADFVKTSSTAFDISLVSRNLIFTSKNAVASFLSNPKSSDFKTSKVFCVGEKTGQILESAGFNVEFSAPYAVELLDFIRQNHPNEHFTFLCGNLRLDTLPVGLKESGISFTEIEVYRTELTPVAINAKIDGILFYSPSGVTSYLRANPLDKQMCFCIGTTTEAALSDKTKRTVVAHRPTTESVIIRCINFYKENHQLQL